MDLLETFQKNIVAGIALGLMGSIGYLIKAHLGRFTSSLQDISHRLDSLKENIIENTTSQAVTCAEIKALWRWVESDDRSTNLNGKGNRDV